MEEMVKSGILGIISLMMLFIGACFTNKDEVMIMEEKTVKVVDAEEGKMFEKNYKEIKKAEAAL